MKVLLAMSGGVDSSVAGALLLDQGHQVVGVTMKLWGGDSDTGCCSVSDVDDARRVAQQLDIDHLVFNFGEDFDRHVVEPYVADHAIGVTPNPCIECNRHVKFDRLLERADQLGFDAVATGHHARIRQSGGRFALERGADPAKDQSYVVHMLDQQALSRVVFPVGDIDKGTVRQIAAARGLRTASKPDSQDVCFITSTGGRTAFLGDRIPFRPGRVVDTAGDMVGEVDAVELVTIGQRRGIGLPGGGPKRYAVDVDVPAATVTVGEEGDLLVGETGAERVGFVDRPVSGTVLVQCSAHGASQPADLVVGGGGRATIRWSVPQRRIAPGQSVVFYDLDDRRVLGGGSATRSPSPGGSA
ncbi:MAG: tRNA 2-thiouridine(34) synthase MnmA [Ilumatobacter sp.]|uniref:tRNA 2-thiouridine(34) synthase MnmA n=1 Tax=Ilumatobacter sp. TaxID=1967498 RepID=UPI00261EF500|nr:tRNA 2-thiouridine(34) synthase MnmA [Ilumatobacter sp.]MDJ0768831.1 tRNA 2-thiouridine(34) synthase MnmA [Ilumatobacter sp.]